VNGSETGEQSESGFGGFVARLVEIDPGRKSVGEKHLA
jgi:hypothetical protein